MVNYAYNNAYMPRLYPVRSIVISEYRARFAYSNWSAR